MESLWVYFYIIVSAQLSFFYLPATFVISTDLWLENNHTASTPIPSFEKSSYFPTKINKLTNCDYLLWKTESLIAVYRLKKLIFKDLH